MCDSSFQMHHSSKQKIELLNGLYRVQRERTGVSYGTEVDEILPLALSELLTIF